jgi:hypothetical protein
MARDEVSGRGERNTDERTRQIMKSLCMGIVGDTARVFAQTGFNNPVDVVELTIFGSFMVTESYVLSRCEDVTPSRLDQFQLDIVNHLTNEVFLKQNRSAHEEEAFAFQDYLYDLMKNRYPEYRKAIRKDLENPNTVFSNTCEAVANNIFVSPPADSERQKLVVPMAIKLAQFWTGCIASFE